MSTASEKFVRLLELTGAKNDLTPEQMAAIDRGEFNIDPAKLDSDLQAAYADKVSKDSEESAGLEGRMRVKNFGDESDPKSLKFLQEKNPNHDVIEVEGKIYARPKGDPAAKFLPLDSSSAELSDITDSAWDLGSGAAAAGVGTLAGLPTAGVGGAAAAAGTAGALNAIKQGIGNLVGVRSGVDPAELGLETATAGAMPWVASAAGKVLRPMSSGVNLLASKLGSYPKSALDRYLKREYQTSLDEVAKGGQKALERTYKKFIDPIFEAQRANKSEKGQAIANVMEELTNKGVKIPYRISPEDNQFYIKDILMPWNNKRAVLDEMAKNRSGLALPDDQSIYKMVKDEMRGVLPSKDYLKLNEGFIDPATLWRSEQLAAEKASKFRGTPGTLSGKDSWVKEASPALDSIAENAQAIRTRLAKDFLDKDIGAMNEAYKAELRSGQNLRTLFGKKSNTTDEIIPGLKKLGTLHSNPLERSYVEGIKGLDQAKTLEGMDFIRNLMDDKQLDIPSGGVVKSLLKTLPAMAKPISKAAAKVGTEVADKQGKEAFLRKFIRQGVASSTNQSNISDIINAFNEE